MRKGQASEQLPRIDTPDPPFNQILVRQKFASIKPSILGNFNRAFA